MTTFKHWNISPHMEQHPDQLPLHSRVGPGLRLFQCQGLVVHELVEIGSGVVLRHYITIAAIADNIQAPKIWNRVDYSCYKKM